MSWFSLSSDDNFALSKSYKLRSYRAVNKGAAMVLTLTVEITDPLEVGYALQELEAIRTAHNRPAPKPGKAPAKTQKITAKAKPLALPAPEDFA